MLAQMDHIFTNHNYEGYGVFDGKDVYALVAMWNQDFLVSHPDYIIPYSKKKVSDFRWYKEYCEMGITEYDLEEDYGLRDIGIDIACYDEDNAALPYPIKITMATDQSYESLPPSKSLGCGNYDYTPEVCLAYSFKALSNCILCEQGCDKCFIYSMGYEAGCHDESFIEDMKEWVDYADDYFRDESWNGNDVSFYRKKILGGFRKQDIRMNFIDSLSEIVGSLSDRDREKINAMIKTRDRVRAEDIIHIALNKSSSQCEYKDKLAKLLDNFYAGYLSCE